MLIFFDLRTIFYEIIKEYDMTNNINILYEDTQILVCVKPWPGVATQSKRIGSPDMVSLLKNHISMTSGKSGRAVPCRHSQTGPACKWNSCLRQDACCRKGTEPAAYNFRLR